ncbi:MAG: LysM peptidoglycan-binding domain-containing protein [Eubacteriales bacterium]
MARRQVFAGNILVGAAVVLLSVFGPIQVSRAAGGTYTVVEGDTLWGIAIEYGTTAEDIISYNYLDTDFLHIGQTLLLPNQSTVSLQAGSSASKQEVTATTTYTVASGDTLWDVANRFGTTVEAIEAANNIDPDSLQIGQLLAIPAGVSTPQVSRGASRPETPAGPGFSGYGELIPWPDVDAMFTKGSTATLQDFETGKQFHIYRLFGGNHADCEPLTPADTKIMKEIFGGQWSWDRRAALLLIDGRAIAASMAGMPHGTSEDIADNNFPGMFDLHFYKSRTHGSNMIDPGHQAAVHEAAGR